MDTLTLARLQFGSTTIYHYFFVPLTLGLILLVAIMETLYVKTGKEVYKRMTKFWGNLFLINFGMGVITGIVQEFQFGMNWSTYSRFVGDVFGAPLAIEALLAFFMESTFLGIWIFGWDQLNKKVHLAVIWIVAFGSYLSAFWILVANSFMQEPVGYAINNGRAEMTDFLALFLHPHLWLQFPHVVAGGLVTGAFFVVGISVYRLMKKKGDLELFQLSLKIGLISAVIGSALVLFTGDAQMKRLFTVQPMKAASAEAHWNTEDPAPLSIFTIGNESTRSNIFTVQVPSLLSFLVYDRPSGEIKGINEMQAQYEAQYGPGDYIPSVITTYWGFRIMVGTGLLMMGAALLALLLVVRKNLLKQKLVCWGLMLGIALPFLGNTAGWVLTEMGRQPWLVQGLLRTADGVSPGVGPVELLTSLIVFALLYGTLGVINVVVLSRYVKQDMNPKPSTINQQEKISVGIY